MFGVDLWEYGRQLTRINELQRVSIVWSVALAHARTHTRANRAADKTSVIRRSLRHQRRGARGVEITYVGWPGGAGGLVRGPFGAVIELTPAVLLFTRIGLFSQLLC